MYLDVVEQATRQPGRKGMIRRNLAEDVLVRQLMQAEKIRRQLDRYMNRAVKADENWLPEVDFVAASAKNTDSIAKALQILRSMRKDAKEARKGLTDEQCDQVFMTTLERVATTMTEIQWRRILSLRFGSDVADVLLREIPA